jgi:hypothetical protein
MERFKIVEGDRGSLDKEWIEYIALGYWPLFDLTGGDHDFFIADTLYKQIAWIQNGDPILCFDLSTVSPEVLLNKLIYDLW